MTSTQLNAVVEDWIAAMDRHNTRSRLLRTELRGDKLHVEVDFTGDFPGGQTGGVFDLTFDGDRIARVTADLA